MNRSGSRTPLRMVHRKTALGTAAVLALASSLLSIAGSSHGAAIGSPQSQASGDNVILVTLDGARVQEIFGGMDPDVARSTLKPNQTMDDVAWYRKMWADSPEERRRKLLPFFWTLVTEQGSIAGDRRLGSPVSLRNRLWFSYPGYAEILTGEPHDTVITSNDPVQNPYETVLEALRRELQLPTAKVATIASWSVFNEIAEHKAGATFTNAGVETLLSGDPELVTLNSLQAEATTPWDHMRFDAFTFRVAMHHLATARPRVLYLAFGETDDWAHDGRYERVLEAYARTDSYLRELWSWIDRQPDYRGRTHLLITTDHGRGKTPKDWRDHGAKIEGADQTWMAFVSPRMARRGAWRNAEEITTSQVAATVASWMGVDWNARHPAAGQPVR